MGGVEVMWGLFGFMRLCRTGLRELVPVHSSLFLSSWFVLVVLALCFRLGPQLDLLVSLFFVHKPKQDEPDC